MTIRRLSTVDAMAQLSFVVQGLLDQRTAAHDSSTTQTRLLGVLRDRKPTMNQLAQLLGLDKSSVTGLVDRAERRGLVARAASPDDGRSYSVILTPSGRRLVDRVARSFESDVSDLLAPLSATDRDKLVSLVTRVLVGRAEAGGVDLFDVDV